MFRLLCPLSWIRLALFGLQLAIKHDETINLIKDVMQKSQDDANRTGREAAESLKR